MLFDFNKLLVSVSAAILFTSLSAAAPWPASSKHTTHRTRELTPDLRLVTFHPESTFETFGTGIDHPLAKRASDDLEGAALSFVQSHLGLAAQDVSFKSGFAGDVATHAFVRQQINGVPVANAVANVAFNNAGKVVSFGSSFIKPSSVPSSTPTLSLQDAIVKAESILGGKFNEWPATLEFIAQEDGSVALTHVVQIQNDETGAWVEAFIDAHSGELVHVTDFVAQSSFFVLPITKETPPEGQQLLTNPEDLASSPDGWNSNGTTTTTDTDGNNVVSFKGATTATTQESGAGLVFDFPPDFTVAPTTTQNVNAARVNTFYVVNTVHDVSYKYGFTEAAFNFQNNNFGKGGVGNDRVTVSVQDSAGTNNADFATPADGQSGRMRMFLWTFTTPERDGGLENDIVTHENTHGITNRMTGGGTGRCLQTTEAGGMGEGWSDAMADWMEHKDATVPDYILGQWVENNTVGIRTHPYSTSATVNPLTYANLTTLTEVHAIGEVWANMLHNVYAGLVGVHGFSATAHTDPTTTGGNTVFLHLFIDALPLQPCNPTFLTGRDAWIQADVNRFAGANKCTLWKEFASRGLGVNAANHVNDFTVPAGC
ncbi:Fungalysin metallopeptidase-domain-containing protein [Cytidiella melzeri]|nr:Fungalysin metallopeptidase-domain-containing protein [Cytidiella melzeri]